MSLPALNPDYVLAVQKDDGLEPLIKYLYDHGVGSVVRPLSKDEVLVFVRVSGATVAELLEKDLLKNYEFGVTAKNDTPADRSRVVYLYLTTPEKVGGLGITPGKGDYRGVKSITPVTDAFAESSLIDDIKQHANVSLTSSTIKNKYGVQTALYFEFLRFYITWLVPLAVFGLVSFLKNKHRFSLTYTFINLVWGVGFLTFWNRRQLYLVHFWGVQNSHSVAEHLSEVSNLNKSFEEHATYKKENVSEGSRFVKQLAFVPVALVFVAVLVSYQLGCFVLEIFLSEIYNGPGKVFLTLLPTILISAFVPVLTIVYNLVTDKVIAWENHDNEYTRNYSVIVKQFVLNFLTSYVPLLITSFIYLPFAHLIEPNLADIRTSIASNVGENRFLYKYLTNVKSQKDFQINQGRLNAQFFYFVVTNQVIQIVLKYALPLVLGPVIKFVTAKVQKKEPEVFDDDEKEAAWLANVRAAVALPAYNVNDDFRGLTLQYGYLALFGPVWSLAPIVSIVFNVITFKLDTIKLTNGKYFQPPVPRRVDSIHPWNYALFLLTWLGSVISPIITVFYRHGTAPPKTLGQLALDKASVNVSSTVYLIAVLFFSEHLFFVLYFLADKVSTLFKSDAEKQNAFLENDIKLRRDYYSEHVKPTFEVEDDGEWKSLSPSTAIKQAATASTLPVTEKAVSSGVAPAEGELTNRSDRAAELREKQAILEQKQAELRAADRQSLEKVKDKEDTIIETKNADGQPTLATIDNNQHADTEPEEPTEPSVANEVEDTSSSDVAKSDSVDKSEKTTKKKSSLKKLLRKK